MSAPETRFVPLGTGRRIAYCTYGDPDGLPVFYFHGTPGSRYEPLRGDREASERGYRILALDRPGIGRSDYARGRRLLDWPDDVAAVAHALNLNTFGVIGASGGGPYALACARAIPERLTAVAVMGSWAPVAADSDLWNAMAPLDRCFGRLSRNLPWAFNAPFALLGYAAKWLSPRGFSKFLASSMGPADRALVADETVARFYVEDVKEAFRQGVRGPATDAMILYGDWGFDVADLGVEVALYHGEEDHFAPFSYALYLDRMIPNTQLHRYPSQGHLFLMGLLGEVLDHMMGVV